MTKKNLKPQKAAPVQREINTTSSEGGTGLTPQISYLFAKNSFCGRRRRVVPLILALTSRLRFLG